MAHVEIVGTLYNNTQEVESGSGILVGDSYILTNNHVIPREQNYQKLDISVRLMSRLLNPLSIRSVMRDPQRDLALLELASPVANASGKRCPMPVIIDPTDVPKGTSIYIMGFPLNQDLSIAGGLVSNQNAGNGYWQTDTLINPGNSGGPAFDNRGALVGIATGGIVKWNDGGGERDVAGVNFIIPSTTITDSPLYATISGIPEIRRCWTTFSRVDAVVPILKESRAKQLNRTYSVSTTKDDHPKLEPDSRTYDQTFQADPDYQITKCTWSGLSENHHHDLICNIGADRMSATFSFRLESGPMFDRWRGWWTGTVTLEQELKP
ncbi:serine protease [Mesorhizobium sp. M0019]|uniref:S1C family serine protease n=1 Tax=Mesorhizobium sp. M0019 TaxID=2956845 RepID=UPI0033357BDE